MPSTAHAWDHAFSIGSAVATFAQGVVLGAFIQGFEVEGRHFVGGTFDCFTPFSLFTGLALMSGYGLLGACWLILKTEGALAEQRAARARQSLPGHLRGGRASSACGRPSSIADIARRWFSWPNILFLSPVPLATA